MDENIQKTASLRHVRFVGRPKVEPPLLQDRTNPSSTKHRDVPALQSEQPCQFISWVFQRAGLEVDNYRYVALQRRLPACLRALRSKNETHARQLLDQNPNLLPKAIDALLIGVTEFLRDPAVFETLRTEILSRFATFSRPLRVWSAGCSNGAELYSVAIVLAQAGLLEESFLLGSDCRRDAIEQARAALYKSSELQNLKPVDRHKYFYETKDLWQPIELLRRNLNWKVADLARCIEGGPWDIILWRNMAIYFKTNAAELVWKGLVSSLAPDGVLITGRAEQPPASLPLISVRRSIYHACSEMTAASSSVFSNKQTRVIKQTRRY